MLGTKERSFRPLTDISLNDLVPADHFYRQLHATLDLAFVRAFVCDMYAPQGRPSIDPIVFFKLQLILFFEGLRSERQLMRVVTDRMSLRWFIGYDLHQPVPHHSSLTRIRDRFGIATFRKFFDAIVDQCQKAGLVWGHDLYFDATQVKANAALASKTARFAIDAHLAHLFADTDSGQQPETPQPADMPAAAPPTPLPVLISEITRAELTQKNEARHDWIAAIGHQIREKRDSGYERKADFIGSASDPDATIMHLKKGGSHFGYHTHYAVDGVKARIILAALVTPSEVRENQPMLDLLWRVQFRWKLRPCQVTGDTTYGTIPIITALEQAGIRAYVPLPNNEERTPFFSKSAFAYDAGRDAYICPAGKLLQHKEHVGRDQVVLYTADTGTCPPCPLNAQCTKSAAGRQISRSYNEEYLERVRTYHTTEAYQRARRKRQVWVEPLFGEGKQWHNLERFRLRSLIKVNSEALLTASGQNIKRLFQKKWRPKGGSSYPQMLTMDLAQNNRTVAFQGCA